MIVYTLYRHKLHAAGQPLITRGPANPLAGASHTFVADWLAAGSAPTPARGARQAEWLPEWGGGRRRGAQRRRHRRRVSLGSRLWLSSRAAQQPVSSPPAAKQPTMLNFGASLQQAAVSHLGMPLSFPASPRLTGQQGCEP